MVVVQRIKIMSDINLRHMFQPL
uniref:Uncharacterized protein n=1 Tax=Arundo donax TaxID=35708 RepID=A0A0A9GNF8_ARUDO